MLNRNEKKQILGNTMRKAYVEKSNIFVGLMTLNDYLNSYNNCILKKKRRYDFEYSSEIFEKNILPQIIEKLTRHGIAYVRCIPNIMFEPIWAQNANVLELLFYYIDGQLYVSHVAYVQKISRHMGPFAYDARSYFKFGEKKIRVRETLIYFKNH